MDNRSADQFPLVVIVGPTASGKTALAIELAEEFEGEIICADSRTVYKGMDVGTAKPSYGERERIPHWGLDLVEPGERFTAADFKQYADQKIEEIRARGHIPFLVGGSGLYVDAVIFDYQFGPRADDLLRAHFNKLSIQELQEYCSINNIELPENQYNKRYLVRAIEQKSIRSKRSESPINTSIIVGITTDRDVLRTRILYRSEQLLKNGVVEEATKLGDKYGWKSEAMTGNIYRIIHCYLNNEFTKEDVVAKNATADWKLAKRQLTWFRRNPYIKWLSLDEAKLYIQSVLANE